MSPESHIIFQNSLTSSGWIKDAGTETHRVKTEYQKEVNAFEKNLQRGDEDPVVKKVQEWLSIWEAYDAAFDFSVERDGFFGRRTQEGVKAFQAFVDLETTGTVDEPTWRALINPMWQAYHIDHALPQQNYSIAETVYRYAFQYEMWRPFEIEPNTGPWVRSFMGGHEGEPWAWCAGFAQTVLDSAFAQFGQKYTDYFEKTYAVETMRKDARKKGILVTRSELEQGLYQPKSGDVFLFIYPNGVAHHTGIVTWSYGSTFFTVEGNTNFAGTHNGVGVFRLKRDFIAGPFEIIRMYEHLP